MLLLLSDLSQSYGGEVKYPKEVTQDVELTEDFITKSKKESNLKRKYSDKDQRKAKRFCEQSRHGPHV